MVGRCNFPDCNLKILKLIGECKYCKNSFCSNHRLPETHLCLKLQDIILKEKNALSKQLENNRVKVSKCIDFS
jgi:predicted nucleic acid binding AN1-type Zn finger protein